MVSVSVCVCCVARATNTNTNHEHQQTPSYLPSYTRLGHAIPGSKTVSVDDDDDVHVGSCGLVSRATNTNTNTNYRTDYHLYTCN